MSLLPGCLRSGEDRASLCSRNLGPMYQDLEKTLAALSMPERHLFPHATCPISRINNGIL